MLSGENATVLKEPQAVTIESKELFKNGTLVRIIHENGVYTLRITKTNKLILTK